MILAILGSAAPAGAASGTQDTLRLFASCAGRLSAQMEFQWLVGDPAAEATESQRSHLISLIEAVQSDADGRHILNWRIDAKVAQAALLSRAHFNDDPQDATWAAEMAAQLTSDCTGLLLS